jgi:hypothetical protein
MVILQRNKVMSVVEDILGKMERMTPEKKRIFLLNALDMARTAGYNEGIKQARAVKDAIESLKQLKNFRDKDNDFTDEK